MLTSSSELKSQLLAGIAMVASLLARCDAYQQIYMAPELSLRPPETALDKLKTVTIQTYIKSQLFLDFALQQQRQSKIKSGAAPLKLGIVGNHVNDLAKCEEQLYNAAEDCERFCNMSARNKVEKFLELQPKFQKIVQDQMYVTKTCHKNILSGTDADVI